MATSRISPARLRNLKPGKYADGGNLWLFVKKNGSASWVLRYRLHGRSHAMGLGPWPDTDAAKARERALRYRNALREGRDPMSERSKERLTSLMTFADAAGRMLKTKEAEWRSSKHAKQWQSTLETYAYPILGALPLDAIETDNVLRALEPIWAEKTETASRLRQRIEAVLDWGAARNLRSGDNPARWRGHLDKLLAKPNKIKKVKHYAALPYTELPDFMEKLAKQPGIAAKALIFTILVAARTGEVIGARKVEILNGLWIVPAERMKAGREHRVALPSQAQTLLDDLPDLVNNPYIFSGQRRDKPLSNMAMVSVLRRMGRGDLTVHGFRASFKTWAMEVSSFPRETIEAALAHTVGNQVEQAYMRGDTLQKRAKLMQSWANYCCTPRVKGSVVTIRKVVNKAAN